MAKSWARVWPSFCFSATMTASANTDGRMLALEQASMEKGLREGDRNVRSVSVLEASELVGDKSGERPFIHHRRVKKKPRKITQTANEQRQAGRVPVKQAGVDVMGIARLTNGCLLYSTHPSTASIDTATQIESAAVAVDHRECQPSIPHLFCHDQGPTLPRRMTLMALTSPIPPTLPMLKGIQTESLPSLRPFTSLSSRCFPCSFS